MIIRTRFKHLAILFFINSLIFHAPYVFASNSQLSYERALSSFNNSKFDESFIILKTALQADPDNLSAKILMAKLLVQRKAYDAAEIEFSEVMQQGVAPNLFANEWMTSLLYLRKYSEIIEFSQFKQFSVEQQIQWQAGRALACISMQNYDCAKQSYLNASKLSKDPIYELNGFASIEFEQGNIKEAKAYGQKVLESSPNNAKALHILGLVAKREGELLLAIDYLQKAYNLSSDDPHILRNLADIYLATNDKNAAYTVIDTILESSPNDPFAILVDSWLHSKSTDNLQTLKPFQELSNKVFALPKEIVNQEPTLLLLRGLMSYLQSHHEQALADFLRLHDQKPEDIQVTILLAKTYLALGKEKPVIELLEMNLDKLQKKPEVQIMLGEIYINRGATFKAIELLENLNNNFKDNIEVQLLNIKVQIARGKYALASDALDKLTIKHPAVPQVLLTHTIFNLQTSNLKEALISINTLLTNEPNNAEWLNIKAAIFIRQSKFENAKSLVEQSLKLKPDLLGAKFNLATIYNAQNEEQEAERLLNQIIVANKTHLPSILLLADIKAKTHQMQQALDLYNLALVVETKNIQALEGIVQILIQQKNFQDALTQLNKLERLSNDNTKYIQQKAHLHLINSDIESSQIEVAKLLARADNDPVLLLTISQIQLKQKDLSGAENSLRQAYKLDPSSYRLGIQLADILINTKQTSSAIKILNDLEKQYPHHPNIVFFNGRVMEQKGNVLKAFQLYNESLTLDDSNNVVLAKMYTLLAHGLKPENFLAVIQPIVDKYPNRYFTSNLLAQFYYYSNNLEKAAAQYEKVFQLEQVPNRAALLNRLANIYMSSDREKGFSYAQKAYELDNNNTSILTTYGWVLTQQNRPAEGLELLRKASVRNSINPSLKYYIAASLSQLGLDQEAKLALQPLFSGDINFAEKKQAKALYDSL